MTVYNMSVKIDFENPLEITSNSKHPDLIRVKLDSKYVFISSITNRPLDNELLYIDTRVPKQYTSLVELKATEASKTAIAAVGNSVAIFALIFQFIA